MLTPGRNGGQKGVPATIAPTPDAASRQARTPRATLVVAVLAPAAALAIGSFARVDVGALLLWLGATEVFILYGLAGSAGLTTKEIAVVSSLAALAAAGRAAFAGIPSVQPATVVIALAGLVFGPRAGFMVGATTALASNFFLGHGPWTIWQMAAWGMVGVTAGWLRPLVLRQRDGGRVRWTLAAFAGLWGLAFGQLMNLWFWLAFIQVHTWQSYVAVQLASLWFDVAHAAGNVVFALAFGPAALKILTRFHRRFMVTYVPPADAAREGSSVGYATLGLTLLLTATLLLPLVLPGAQPRADAAQAGTALGKALDYLRSHQKNDGGFAQSGDRGNDMLTAWAVCAITAAREDPASWTRAGRTPLDMLRGVDRDGQSLTDWERTLLAVAAAGGDVHDLRGVDLVAKVKAEQSDSGLIGSRVNTHIWGMLALSAAGADVPAKAVRWLKGQQNSDGGWGWGQTIASDTNDAAAALQALVAAGDSTSSDAVRHGIAYLKARQRADGGFSYIDRTSDSGSTSWVIQGLIATGEHPAGSAWSKNGRTPLGRLIAFQTATGAIRYTSGQTVNPLFMTIEAIPALSGRAWPVRHTSGLRDAPERRPRVSGPVPGPGTQTKAGRVLLGARVTDGGAGTGVAASGVALTLNGRRLRTRCSFRAGRARFTLRDLAPGRYRAVLTATDRAGNRTSRAWEFQATEPDPSAASSAAPSSTSATAAAQATLTGTATGIPGSALSADSAPLSPTGVSTGVPGPSAPLGSMDPSSQADDPESTGHASTRGRLPSLISLLGSERGARASVGRDADLAAWAVLAFATVMLSYGVIWGAGLRRRRFDRLIGRLVPR